VVGALDLGTTGVRFFLFDLRARPIASAYRELPLSFPRPGWVEQDPGAMVEGALSVIREALEKAGLSPADLLGFGLTNQRGNRGPMGERHGKAPWAGHRLAGPAHRRALPGPARLSLGRGDSR